MTFTAVEYERTYSGLAPEGVDLARVLFEQAAVLEWSKADSSPGTQLPEALISRYVMNAMRAAEVSYLRDSAVHFAEIPGFTGVWGEGKSARAACHDLEGALRSWIGLKIADGDCDMPEVGGINLNVL